MTGVSSANMWTEMGSPTDTSRDELLRHPVTIDDRLDFVLAEPEPAPAISEDQRMLPYAEPGQLVDIGGRRINLQCMGTNGPTVVLMSGIFSWSLIRVTCLNCLDKRL